MGWGGVGVGVNESRSDGWEELMVAEIDFDPLDHFVEKNKRKGMCEFGAYANFFVFIFNFFFRVQYLYWSLIKFNFI